MSEWFHWTVGSANPFVDFSTIWIEPLIQHAVDFSHRVEPDVLCTLAYLACMGSAYLFHSPFRAHATAAMDTYGRVTKVFQTWSTIIFFCFHIGPQLFRDTRPKISSVDTKDTVPILFFPLFIIFTICFGFLHKVKRRWGLSLTYGSRFSVIALNSLVLAALGTAHYAYCHTLRPNASHYVWRFILYYLMPSSIVTHPFWCVSKLLLLSACFITADYHYKKWMGCDPARGILWAELYELNKGRHKEALMMKRNSKEGQQDWRELVAPPRVYTPAAPNARATAAQATAAAVLGVPVEGRIHGAVCYSSVTIDSAARTAPAPRILYHECPPDVNLDLLESSYDADDADLRHICGGAGGVPLREANRIFSASTVDNPPSPNTHLEGAMSRALYKLDHTDPNLTALTSFRTPQLFVKEVQEAQHPVNRPGMVPWWSTFVLLTVWQTVAGTMLRFLSFDVRTIQGYTTPKIFHLHFSSSLRDTIRSATEAFSRSTAMYRCTSCDGIASSSGLCSLCALGSHGAPSHNDEDQGVRKENACFGECCVPAAAAASPLIEPDVWFDWIADVGDGFNPTYAMARLLAQPMLRLPMAATRKAKWRRRFPSDAGKVTGVDNYNNLAGRAALSTSAPTSPTARKPGAVEEEATTLELPRAASFSTANGPDMSTAGRTENTTLPQPLLRLARTHGAAAAVQGSTMRARRGVGKNHEVPMAATTGSLDPNSPIYPRHTLHRRVASEDSQSTKSTASRSLLNVEKDGFVSLPRGSFVLVGGDLAYPSPNDETYTTRLFEPYHDAMSGNVRLQSVFHAEQQRVIVADASDADVAHVHLLDAETVSGMATGRAALRTGRATAEEALRSVPLLFAIPGNHDWFDGLSTFHKYILERTWIGGWLMPQRSSFFVLRLPYNWFILCGDTGNMQDVDVAQRNYFLDVIEKYMDVESCVILAVHEPGWVYDSMLHKPKLAQPELSKVCEALGTRLRLRLAGDIHHYSRHVPVDASSEAATLVVSGGGGAFLHGARNDSIISQGTKYVRACAFPEHNTLPTMLNRLLGFRVINWKFDLIIGVCSFLVVVSLLPQSIKDVRCDVESGPLMTLPDAVAAWWERVCVYIVTLFSKGIASLLATLGFLAVFASAGVEKDIPVWMRLLHSCLWTFLIVLICCSMLAYLICTLQYMAENHLLVSADDHWGSVLEDQVFASVDGLLNHTKELLGGPHASVIAHELHRLQTSFYGGRLVSWCGVILRCLDPFEMLAYLSEKVSSPEMGTFAGDASRVDELLYYLYFVFFYWTLVTPLVSFVIGSYLMCCVTLFDCLYDAAYSAFQIEEYKHFVRFRLDVATRELHAYVVALRHVPKSWTWDSTYQAELKGEAVRAAPPHLRAHPSRWHGKHFRATSRCDDGKRAALDEGVEEGVEILEHFVCSPHRLPMPLSTS